MTTVLEEISNGELWIWRCYIGKPGLMNDIHILDCPPLVASITERSLLPHFDFEVNARKHYHPCFSVDGIDPHWSIFVFTVSVVGTKNKKMPSSA